MLGKKTVTAAAIACIDNTPGGDQMLGRIVKWAIALFVIFYVVTDPTGAGALVHSAVNGLRSAGQSLARFVGAI